MKKKEFIHVLLQFKYEKTTSKHPQKLVTTALPHQVTAIKLEIALPVCYVKNIVCISASEIRKSKIFTETHARTNDFPNAATTTVAGVARGSWIEVKCTRGRRRRLC